MKPIVRRVHDLADLKDYLRFGNAIWKGATIQQIGFRGQANASWYLTPKSFRSGVLLGFGDSVVSPPSSVVVDQTRAEYEAVRAFVELGDRVGLELPGDIGRFRAHRNRRGSNAENFWTKEWPNEEDLELLAIAQHHGVPTRLLDFTHSPYVAAYFAASECLKLIDHGEKIIEFAIWGVDLRFFRTIQKITNRQSSAGGVMERIREVQVPRHSNNFLRAQSGFFILDNRANANLGVNGRVSLERAFMDRADQWKIRKGYWGTTKFTDFFLPYVKLRILSGLAKDTLRFLHGEGIHAASIFPSHDRIQSALEFMRRQGHDLE